MIHVVRMRAIVPTGANVINACSNSDDIGRDLSPFLLGPVHFGSFTALNVENAWQYLKVYKQHVGHDGMPTQAWWEWAKAGWANPKAVRYPMGRGAKPEFSFWDGRCLGYVDARKQIYAPLYANAVIKTAGYRHLQDLQNLGKDFYIRDFDGYDEEELGMSLTDVLNNPHLKMGHAFVLKMLLTMDPALKQCGPIGLACPNAVGHQGQQGHQGIPK